MCEQLIMHTISHMIEKNLCYHNTWILDTYLFSVIFQVASYTKPKSSCPETLQPRPVGTSPESGTLLTDIKDAAHQIHTLHVVASKSEKKNWKCAECIENV